MEDELARLDAEKAKILKERGAFLGGVKRRHDNGRRTLQALRSRQNAEYRITVGIANQKYQAKLADLTTRREEVLKSIPDPQLDGLSDLDDDESQPERPSAELPPQPPAVPPLESPIEAQDPPEKSVQEVDNGSSSGHSPPGTSVWDENTRESSSPAQEEEDLGLNLPVISPQTREGESLSGEFPTVIYMKGHFHEIKCHNCGTNSTRNGKDFFLGARGILDHIRIAHERLYPKHDFRELDACIVRTLDREEVQKLENGIQPADPLVKCGPQPFQRPQIPDAQPKISHPDVPGNVIQDEDDEWFRISCRICRGNADDGLEWYDGEQGLWEHIWDCHPQMLGEYDTETWDVLEDVGRIAFKEPLEEGQVYSICQHAMENPRRRGVQM
ncbi:hypothetical protein CLAFUW4_07972 [Fulvia fulva]|nr:hypothetical protein CLAFUR4_07977 [Fulvia fulva]WPV12549.1 hypothetical protein CLAFUW4_07972 [Fulvia fulva]WPV27225.1 hypothetical protein CLAFUW7_07973 [Fulvia fulva]